MSTVSRLEELTGPTGLRRQIAGYAVAGLLQGTAIAALVPILRALGSADPAAAVAWLAGSAAAFAGYAVVLAFRWIRRSTRPAREEEAAALTEVADRVLEFARAQPVLRAAGSTGTGLANLDASLRADRHATLRVLSRQSHPGLAYALVVQTGFQVAANGLRGIREVVGTPALPEPECPREPAGAGIEFSDVTFGYPGGDPVLRGFSLVCAPGTMTALVGLSGAGKTTVTRLVARFFDVDAGAVRIGGTDVRDMTTATLMRQVAMVFQDVYLFDATIEENVRLGRPDATDAEVRAAARAARLDEVVERLPLGWATTVGEAGGRLSGGERQRVSIARALLKDAPVVLLDEITAALDVENEAAVAEALGRLAGDRTVLVVAHRLTTIAAADRIAVLADGGIAELGTHSELAAAGGRYAGYLAPAVRAHPAEDPR